MWELITEKTTDSRCRRFSLHRGGIAATYRDVIDAWREDQGFRGLFNDKLSEVEFSAYRWETPPVTLDTEGRTFEFVLIDTPGLARQIDAKAFAERFDSNAAVVRFENLGGDAELIVPCPLDRIAIYGHLASFVRSAPAIQCDQLWRMVGEAMTSRLGKRPVWLSTAGMGVSWLHVRLDSRPKYYSYTPYRDHPQSLLETP